MTKTYPSPIADSLLHATLEATADGILVVDLEGRIVGRNTNFLRIWAVPTRLQHSTDGEALLRHMCDQVADSDDLLAQVAELTAEPQRRSRGETVMRDRRVVERYSLPQELDGVTIGRVWSFRDVTEERALRTELQRRALSDTLTGILNRAGFLADLDERLTLRRAQQHQHSQHPHSQQPGIQHDGFAVCLLDLDGFKYVNDAYGHRSGDQVLRTVANRLVAATGPDAVVARLGGDEFGLLLPGSTGAEIQSACERAVAAIAEPVTLAPGLVGLVSASAGWTLVATGPSIEDSLAESEPATADRLLHEADLAMYRAKEAGPSQVVPYTHELRRLDPLSAWAEVSDLIADSAAIAVEFQPIFVCASGEPFGYEALARFPGREHRSVSEWFAAGRSTGLSDVLEARCLEEALRAGRHRPPGTKLTVNVSPVALVTTRVRQVLDRDLSGVIIELTEEVKGDIDVLVPATRWLTDRGAELAIDDAGEGYSGLRRLVQLSPSLVKLDAHLVTGLDRAPEKAALVESLVGFCARTGATLCAEGVETLDELRVLRHLGVELVQGFALAVPSAEFGEISEQAAGQVGAAGVQRGDLAPGLAAIDALAETGWHHDCDHTGSLRDAIRLITPALGVDQVWLTRVEGPLLIDMFNPLTSRMQYDLHDYPVTEEVLRTGVPRVLQVSDASVHPSEARWLRETNHASVLLAPIRTPEGHSVGLLECFNVEPRTWARDELAAAAALCRRLAWVFERCPRQGSTTTNKA